jgi:hypothetical protein
MPFFSLNHSEKSFFKRLQAEPVCQPTNFCFAWEGQWYLCWVLGAGDICRIVDFAQCSPHEQEILLTLFRRKLVQKIQAPDQAILDKHLKKEPECSKQATPPESSVSLEPTFPSLERRVPGIFSSSENSLKRTVSSSQAPDDGRCSAEDSLPHSPFKKMALTTGTSP